MSFEETCSLEGKIDEFDFWVVLQQNQASQEKVYPDSDQSRMNSFESNFSRLTYPIEGQ